MVIIQGGLFEITGSDGSIQTDFWPPGVYDLPAESISSAYKNIGTTEFKALRFEIKD